MSEPELEITDDIMTPSNRAECRLTLQETCSFIYLSTYLPIYLSTYPSIYLYTATLENPPLRQDESVV